MAQATITVTVNTEAPSFGKVVQCLGTLAISASPDTYATGGLALGAAEFAGKIKLSAGNKPDRMIVNGIAGYHYEYDQANGKLIIRQQKDPANAGGADIPLTEFGNGVAIAAGLSGDTISFTAFFTKFKSA